VIDPTPDDAWVYSLSIKNKWKEYFEELAI